MLACPSISNPIFEVESTLTFSTVIFRQIGSVGAASFRTGFHSQADLVAVHNAILRSPLLRAKQGGSGGIRKDIPKSSQKLAGKI
jgi:hypothetical protein